MSCLGYLVILIFLIFILILFSIPIMLANKDYRKVMLNTVLVLRRRPNDGTALSEGGTEQKRVPGTCGRQKKHSGVRGHRDC